MLPDVQCLPSNSFTYVMVSSHEHSSKKFSPVRLSQLNIIIVVVSSTMAISCSYRQVNSTVTYESYRYT
jgi:hypothetical protein